MIVIVGLSAVDQQLWLFNAKEKLSRLSKCSLVLRPRKAKTCSASPTFLLASTTPSCTSRTCLESASSLSCLVLVVKIYVLIHYLRLSVHTGPLCHAYNLNYVHFKEFVLSWSSFCIIISSYCFLRLYVGVKV
jgi:hypothetical protein